MKHFGILVISLLFGLSGCSEKDKNYYSTNKKAAIEKYKTCNESKNNDGECLIAYDVISELYSSAKKKFAKCKELGMYKGVEMTEECAEAKSNASNLSDILGLADTTDNKGIGY